MKPESRTQGRPGVPGWERLRHGGLLLDATRLAALSRLVPAPLDDRAARQLRQRAGGISDANADSGAISSFVAFVLEEVCGLDASTGNWARGNNVSPSWGRRAITGETVKPRHLWTGRNGGRLPVFLDVGRRLGVGRGRRIVSQVLGWLRAGNDHLALVTNGRQWRLLFAGLDYDAWCEWDLDLWFEEGELSPQVTALRTLLGPGLWTPETEDAAAPLLQAIRDTRKGQAELSEVLGERVREAVEFLIRGHGEALSALAGTTEADAADYRAYLEDVAGVSSAEAPSDDDESFPGATPQDIYRAACRVAMRLVVILFAESRELLPRDNALYHESYGLNGLLERLERTATRGGALAASFGAWPRVLALFGIENRDKVFPIDSRFKFNPVIVSKGGATDAIRTAFMRRKLDDWESAENFATAYTREQVERFSPRSRAILEIQSGRDLEILEKIYADSVLLGDDGPDGWGIRYAAEFHMTNDSRLFPPRPQWEAKGYRPDEYSRWLLGDWRPIEELWEELGVDPTRPEPVDIELDEWLFETTAGPERREAQARFVHGHLLKPGDVARTGWRERCAQPPYDGLPIPRAKIPPGVILSREGDSWIREEHVGSAALPVYLGKMIYVGDWAAASAPRETPGRLDLDPEYLIGAEDLRHDPSSGARVVFRDISNATNERTLVSTLVPGQFPCGNVLPVLERQSHDVAGNLELGTYLSSLTSDWSARQRMAGTHLNWHVAEPLALPPPASMPVACREHVAGLLLYGLQFAGEWIRLERATMATADSAAAATLGSGHRPVGSLDRDVASWSDAQPLRSPEMQRRQRPQLHPYSPAERLRLRAQTDAIATALFGISSPDLRHMLADCDYPRTDPGRQSPKGFWRVDRDKAPELRHTVLTLIAFHDLESKIQAADGNREKGIEAFLAQNHGEGWMLPETLCLADYGLGHDERARHPQPVASRLGPRFYDWQLVQSADESSRECHLHARNLLGGYEYAHLVVERIERRAADGEDYVGTLTDRFTRELLGDDGFGTVLYEIRSRNVADQDSYWTTVTTLRDDGHLADDTYGQLLDKLHARGLLDDIGYLRRRDGIPLALVATGEHLSRVAEGEADYLVAPRSKNRQADFFD